MYIGSYHFIERKSKCGIKVLELVKHSQMKTFIFKQKLEGQQFELDLSPSRMT